MKASYVFNFEDVMTDITSHFKKIDTNQYRTFGATPIIDQSAKDFCGYTDIEPEVDLVTPPYIVFGDHTRRFKFVDVDFVLGADGTKVLKAKVDADHKYLFHFLNSIKLEEAGYSRHYKYLKRTKLFVPPLAEQQRIAALLDTADRILKQRESAIAKLENLIRSYFEEIVLKNSSKDELVELGSVVELKYGKSLPSQNRRVGKYNVYGSNGVVGSHIESITSGETIIVGRKGSFGEINLSLESCFPIDTTYYIDKSATKQNIVWLRYALETLKLNTLNKSAAVPGLNREDAYRQKLQLIGRSLQNDFEIYARKVWEIIKIQNDFICKHKKLIASIQHQSFAVN